MLITRWLNSTVDGPRLVTIWKE